MALTVLEELQVLKGEVSPSVILLDLIHQVAVSEGITFHTTYKSFDGTVEVEAQLYLTKVLSVIGRVYAIESNTVQSLQKLIVSLIGDSGSTFTQVQNATDAQWETFIKTNMLRTFELLGRVLKSEKTAYEALP
jgi:hypothetical protein